MGMLEKIYEICPSGGILIWVEKICSKREVVANKGNGEVYEKQNIGKNNGTGFVLCDGIWATADCIFTVGRSFCGSC